MISSEFIVQMHCMNKNFDLMLKFTHKNKHKPLRGRSPISY